MCIRDRVSTQSTWGQLVEKKIINNTYQIISMLYNPTFSFLDNQYNYQEITPMEFINEKPHLINMMENDVHFEDYLMNEENVFQENQYLLKNQQDVSKLSDSQDLMLSKKQTQIFEAVKKVSMNGHDSNSTQYEFDGNGCKRSFKTEELSQKNSESPVMMKSESISTLSKETRPKTEIEIQLQYIKKQQEFVLEQQEYYFEKIEEYQPLKYKDIFPFQETDILNFNNAELNLEILKLLRNNQINVAKNAKKYFKSKSKLEVLKQRESFKIKKQKAEDFMQNSRFQKKKNKIRNKYFNKKQDFLKNHNQEISFHSQVKIEESNF
eukprot:TRINITY_DN252_c0_g1_i1.p1 TRINITY_DN252_c0_g1~~TRINITY_DN252_c0_g1_i1.p1  ORF type:complete len:323 (+),score=74.89 TRINITY_DN252_c0_g1_i1:72-1040(+)